MHASREITALLRGWSDGDRSAGDELLPLIYDELHRRSRNMFRAERAGHTLQPTALINEAYVRLIDVNVDWRDRAHFFAMASTMMRRLLIDHAKSRLAEKRGGDRIKVTLSDASAGVSDTAYDFVDLSDALDSLRCADERKANIVDLHYFGGLTVDEIHHVTGFSVATIGRDLRFARAWLSDALGNSGDEDSG